MSYSKAELITAFQIAKILGKKHSDIIKEIKGKSNIEYAEAKCSTGKNRSCKTVVISITEANILFNLDIPYSNETSIDVYKANERKLLDGLVSTDFEKIPFYEEWEMVRHELGLDGKKFERDSYYFLYSESRQEIIVTCKNEDMTANFKPNHIVLMPARGVAIDKDLRLTIVNLSSSDAVNELISIVTRSGEKHYHIEQILHLTKYSIDEVLADIKELLGLDAEVKFNRAELNHILSYYDANGADVFGTMANDIAEAEKYKENLESHKRCKKAGDHESALMFSYACASYEKKLEDRENTRKEIEDKILKVSKVTNLAEFTHSKYLH